MNKSIIIAGFFSFNSLFSNPTGNARLELFLDTKNANLSTADTQTSLGYSNSITVRRG